MAIRRKTIASKIKNYTQWLFCVKILRYLFFFYSFISFIFWFLNCFEVDWLYMFEKLFIIPYVIVHKIYAPTGVSADYTLAIIGGISMFLGFFCDILSNFYIYRIDKLEEEEERLLIRQKNRARIRHQKAVQSASNEIITPVQMENSKLIFIIAPHVEKIKRNEQDLELTFQEVEIWKQRVTKKFLENVIYSKPLQKGYYRKNLFLIYKDFYYVDDFIYYINPTLDSLIMEFKKYGITVSFCYVLSALTQMPLMEKELDCMDTILSLNFINEIVVTNIFKLIYENKANQKYTLTAKGEYNLSKNLAISNKQSLYKLTAKKRTGEKYDNENNKNGAQ